MGKRVKKSNQTLELSAASIVPRILRNSYFFSNYESINETVINKNDLDSIVTTRLKKFLYRGFFDKNLIKKINQFKNLEDIQLQILYKINFNIKLNLDQIRNLVVECGECSECKIIIDNNLNKLEMICTDNGNCLQIKNQESIKDAYYLCNCDLNNIVNAKNLKILQLSNPIDNELIDKIRNELFNLDKIVLKASLSDVSEENIVELKEIARQNQNLTILFCSIKLNSDAVLDLNKSRLENQIINYDYLDEYVCLDYLTIDFNDLIKFTSNIVPKFNFDSKFFNHYKSITTVKVTLNSTIQLDKLKNLLKNIIHLNKLIIIIEHHNFENSLENLIYGLEKKIISLEIKKVEDDEQCNLDFLFKLDMHIYISSFETNCLIDNGLLKKFKQLIQLENLKFRKVINQEIRTVLILACDDERGKELFAVYLDANEDCDYFDLNLNKSIDYVLTNLN